MNKILLNGLHYEANGAGISNYTHHLIDAFIAGDYPVDILIRGEFGDKYRGKNMISVDKSLPSSTQRIIEEQWGKKQLYKQYGLVHFPDYATPIFYRGSKVATIHDMAMHTMKDKYTMMQNITKRTLLEATIKGSSHLICDSEFAKKELLHYYPHLEAQVSVIHLGIKPPKVAIHEGRGLGYLKALGIREKYILCVGTLAPHKNVAHLIRAFGELKKENRDYQLVIAGKKGWMYEEIFETVKELNLESDVILTGFVDEEQLEALYQYAEFYVSLSLYEGFGLPPLEAMVRGCPVLVSDLEIFKETCKDSALFCNPNDIKAAVIQMQRLIEDEALRGKLKSLGRERAKAFSWETTAKRTYEVYEKVLK